MSRYEKIMLRTIALCIDRELSIFLKKHHYHHQDYISFNSIDYHNHTERFIMPRAKNKTRNNTKPNADKKVEPVWITIRLTDEDMAEILDRYATTEVILEHTADYFVSGYDLSVSYRESYANFACYIGGTYLQDDDNIYKIASYAPTALHAIAVALYKLSLFLEHPEDLKSGAPKMAFG